MRERYLAYPLGTEVAVRGQFAAVPSESNAVIFHAFFGQRLFAEAPPLLQPMERCGVEILAQSDGQHILRVRIGHDSFPNRDQPISVREQNRFVLSLDKGKLSFELNGEVIFDHVFCPINHGGYGEQTVFGFDEPPAARAVPVEIEIRKPSSMGEGNDKSAAVGSAESSRRG